MNDLQSQSLAAGQQLTGALARGWRPAPIRVPFHLPPGECCYSHHQGDIAQLLAGDGTYVKKSTFGIGVLPFAMMAANAVGNSHRRNAAAREAMPRFRLLDSGNVYLTDRRLAIQGRMGWIDVWYQDIRMSYCDGIAVRLEMAGAPPLRLCAWPAYWIYAMIRFMSLGEIVDLGGWR